MSGGAKNRQDFLVEIGTEELPPKALLKLSDSFSDSIRKQLEQAGLEFSDVTPFAAPRRLAVLVGDLQSAQPDKTVQRRGPAVKAAFNKDGNPTKAATGFAQSCNTTVDKLETIKTDKGEWLGFTMEEKGKSVQILAPEIVEAALDQLPIPKRMRWGSLDVAFVRPVHWIVMLHGADIIDTTIYSVKSGNETRGHRFHAPENIAIASAGDYEQTLNRKGKVVAGFDQRKNEIRKQVETLAANSGANAVIDEALLDEVTSMVEWPVAVMGEFESQFLDVPAEALISAMKNHQKYFHLVDDKNQLTARFITVSNIESQDEDQVRKGNERVIRPRLSDAEFFWNQDRKTSLDSELENLKSVVFQSKLGSLYDKAVRISKLAGEIGASIGADKKLAERAALISKCDLMTEMVGEFPELQGIMGRYYAEHDKEKTEVSNAIDEHYKPRFSGDTLPGDKVSQAVALADKFDTLVGIFGIGQVPTGDKDPFGLRRAALGCIRILVENSLDLDLHDLLKSAKSLYKKQGGVSLDKKTADAVYDFFVGRIEVYFSNQGFGHDIIDAVFCLKPGRLLDAHLKLVALKAFRELPESESLAAANKRISNILKKSGVSPKSKIDSKKLKEDAEKLLAEKLGTLRKDIEALCKKADYEAAMKLLANLKDPVDDFFDNVMVMDENKALRDNRLALLKSLRDQFLNIADISRLQH